MNRTSLILMLVAAITAAGSALAEPTRIDVRVKSKGAKFVGSSMGGAGVVIRNADTGEILAEGVTRGTTGDTARIMKHECGPKEPLSTPDAAVYRAEIDLDHPTQVLVEARGPLAQPQAMNRVTATQWIVPGKHVTGGDGFLLELPGFAVDILSPPAHAMLSEAPATVDLKANVVMMCGCPVEPGGIWDSNNYEIKVILKRDGKHVLTEPLEFAGKTSQFRRRLQLEQAGVYEATVYAYGPANGNTGLDRTTFIISGGGE